MEISCDLKLHHKLWNEYTVYNLQDLQVLSLEWTGHQGLTG